MKDVKITKEIIEQHGLTEGEYKRIVEILGREPNITELGIYSVMWSEHCSYKSSRIYLKRLPTDGECVIQGPGENAGVVDIGFNKAIVFKIESHNHPSFIEPYQGAATGVGGIVRDIFTMGARPIALMNSLRFGPLSEKENVNIMEGVVSGIAGYGNCLGIPDVGGEVYFDKSYSGNPLVNAFCLGIADKNSIFYGKASGVGNPVIYVGSRTGRDGIHGATMASSEFDEKSEEKRPNVQVGDPFLEKLLLEACLEAFKTGYVVGIQDMGAAGLTCSSCEMGSRGDTGIMIDLEKVPLREEGMTPYEIMLSESQERMLLTVEKGKEDEIINIFKKWDLEACVIGEVTDDNNLTVMMGSDLVAKIPNKSLTDECPIYKRPVKKPDYLDEVSDFDPNELPVPGDLNRVFFDMISSPSHSSRRWIYEQYDHMVRTNTVVLPGSDAAVLRIKGLPIFLAMSLDGNGKYCHFDPKNGGKIAVAESCRNIVCSGGKPLAATNCLNFASPENPEVMWCFSEVIEGMREACEMFNTPITGGNVSFYNETMGEGIFSTPVIGMVGVVRDRVHITTAGFKDYGDMVVLLGKNRGHIGASDYLELVFGEKRGLSPQIDLKEEFNLQGALYEMIVEGYVKSAHDCSEGGLAITLAESCFLSHLRDMGVFIELPDDLREDFMLFGEDQSRVVISIDEDDFDKVKHIAEKWNVPISTIGFTTKGKFEVKVGNHLFLYGNSEFLRNIWKSALDEYFK